jgi:hypothetical protein
MTSRDHELRSAGGPAPLKAPVRQGDFSPRARRESCSVLEASNENCSGGGGYTELHRKTEGRLVTGPRLLIRKSLVRAQPGEQITPTTSVVHLRHSPPLSWWQQPRGSAARERSVSLSTRRARARMSLTSCGSTMRAPSGSREPEHLQRRRRRGFTSGRRAAPHGRRDRTDQDQETDPGDEVRWPIHSIV